MKSAAIYRIRKGVPGVGRKLANALNAQEVTSKNPTKSLDKGSVVVNYGRSTTPKWWNKVENGDIEILNKPSAVALAVDKRKTLATLRNAGVSCLDATTIRDEAVQWIQEGFEVIVRATAKGKKGNGVSLATSVDELPEAPLYTKHYAKTHEFRVHVFKGKVIDYVQKKKMGKEKRGVFGLEEVNDLVRNHKRGWVFAHNNILHREQISQLAIQAAEALGLDFAGVDILARFSKNNGSADGYLLNSAVVCEVNSAPGMSASATFNAYVDAFNSYLHGPVFNQPPADVE